jgi:hypothetical protein
MPNDSAEQSVFAHKKTALAITDGLCGQLFCTLLITKTYCTSSEWDSKRSFMEMQGIFLRQLILYKCGRCR